MGRVSGRLDRVSGWRWDLRMGARQQLPLQQDWYPSSAMSCDKEHVRLVLGPRRRGAVQPA